MKKPKKGTNLSKIEREFIDLNWTKMSDKELSERLKRDKKTIFCYRKMMGYAKYSTADFENKNNIIGADGTVSTAAKEMSAKMNEEERKAFFEEQLKNSIFYNMLKKEFSPDELDYYCEEYGALAVQFADIITTEKRQVHEFITTEIFLHRIISNIKKIEEEIALEQTKIEEFRKTHDMENDEDAQLKDDYMTNICRLMAASSDQMSKNYTTLVKQKQDILESLNATRKNRADQLNNAKTTFAGLIEALRSEDMKAKHGRMIELIKLGKNNKMKKWSKPQSYCDGSIDIPILDENADLEELTRRSKHIIEDHKQEILDEKSSAKNKNN